MMFSNKSIFDKIDSYLTKKGHELVMSIFLNNYNNNNIYVRVDYVRKLSVYKIVWFDLNFIDIKKIEAYVNSQMLTKYMAVRLMESLSRVTYESKAFLNERILGDRVEVVTYLSENPKEYVFDRFLPAEMKEFIDIFAIVFSYMPRGMEVFLNEIFAGFDGVEEKFNCLKPFKFDLIKDDLSSIFRKSVIAKGERCFEENCVKFLEKVEKNYYLALIEEDEKEHLCVIRLVNETFVHMWCSCKSGYYCRHLYAALKALREKKYNSFYKVKYIGKEESILDKVTISNYYLCYGIRNGKLLLVNDDGTMFVSEVIQNGKIAFEVLEDDDDCTLSKQLNDLKK